jgi:hypothetical protein
MTAIALPAAAIQYLAAAGCGAIYAQSAPRDRLLLGAAADLGAACTGRRSPPILWAAWVASAEAAEQIVAMATGSLRTIRVRGKVFMSAPIERTIATVESVAAVIGASLIEHDRAIARTCRLGGERQPSYQVMLRGALPAGASAVGFIAAHRSSLAAMLAP